MDVLRTPDSRFENLAGHPFAPHYVDVAAADTDRLRMHYVDEGTSDGPPIVLLHGEPTWSYLYRTMIPPLVDGGRRVLAPDLVGFGRSDKPSRIEDYTYLRHVEWVTSWFDALGLRDVTLFVQDWGSLIGLRLAAEQPRLVGRIVVANGALPAGQQSAPFPDKTFQAGARAFPQLVPTSPDDPALPANRAAWEALGRWEKPFLCVFGARDPILGRMDAPLIEHVPGAAGQPHDRINGSHFVQEDCGPELAARILAWDPVRR
jgi:haloalkane dehalogenase